MENQEIILLIDRYNKGIATPKERTIVDLWYISHLNGSENTLSPKLPDELKFDIFNGLVLSDRKDKVTRFSLYQKYAVAAVLLITLSTYAILGLLSKQDKHVDTISQIKPGSDKAILILASGKKIVLNETAQNGNKGIKEIIAIHKGEIVYSKDNNSSVGENILQTPKGGKYKVVLSDGSQIWLNSDSKLKYPGHFSGSTRTVTLEGEAYFEVTKNEDAPFIVQAEGINVRVLGTGFNIKAYRDEEAVKTTLVHGSVTVGNDMIMSKIQPGTQASLTSNSKKIEFSNPNIDEVLAWKEGDFRFEGADIRSLMKQVSRWYDVEIIYSGPVSTHKFFGVIPRKDQVENILEILEETRKVHFKLDGKKIIVINGPNPASMK